MIHTLELNGFKSFLSDEIEFGQLTILSGLNSSGKSSVIQALTLLDRAAKGLPVYLDGHGSFTESYNRFADEGISLKCTYDIDSSIEITVGIENEKISNNVLTQSCGESPFPEIIHIAADRFGPETSIPIHSYDDKLGKRGENIIKSINANGDKILSSLLRHEQSEGETFEFNLKAWLKVVSPNADFDSNIDTISDSSYSIFNGYRAKNVGFGLSYTLPVITALLLGSITPGCVVILENPEAHLHPRGQTEIARLIGLCVEAGVQIIIETHSDHLFDGIRLFAKNREGDSFSKKVKGYWFELDHNANTEVETVNIDGNGRVNHWPKGMFDQFSINASQLL